MRRRVVTKGVRRMAEIGRNWMEGEGTRKTDEIVERSRILEREVRESQQPWFYY